MDTYWILEYVKILGGYLFLMFLWPSVVFGAYLREKSKKYRFSFCVTVQIVIINTVVLLSGLLGILSTGLTAVIFYGIFLAAILRKPWVKTFLTSNNEVRRRQFQSMKKEMKSHFQVSGYDIYARLGEYILLAVVILFGMLYFSYGAFQVHSYGVYDVFVHHGWVNKLVEGQVFPNGIYPEGMHCFIYCLYALFGIRIYSSMLYLQSVHIVLFFLSAYILLREVFGWRYSPIFALCLYMILDREGGHSMYRLSLTMPMEFGLHTQFLCGAYLVRYLKRAGYVIQRGKISKFRWDENLFLFMMALAASIASHYHTTIMAFIICASFALFYSKKIFRPSYLLPLVVSVFCGCMIAAAPMVGGLIKGIPFEGSINWALTTMTSDHEEIQGTVPVDMPKDMDLKGHPLELTQEDLEVIDQLPGIGQQLVKGLIKIEYFIKMMYERGYQGMFEPERGVKIFRITVGMFLFCVISRWKKFRNKARKEYIPLILISSVSVFFCLSCLESELGLPMILPEHRFCAEGLLMIYAVMMMPIDFLISTLAWSVHPYILQTLSYFFCIGMWTTVYLQGNLHEYLNYSLNRYDAAVQVTNSIIEEFPKDSYTIVSPMEETFQVALYGEHEEISEFLEKSGSEDYTLPTEYIFIYIEKRPIVYHQIYFFDGPKWLGISPHSQIRATVISKEAAAQDLTEYEDFMWGPYAKGRTVMESKAYEWCQDFSKKYSDVLKVYYEDEDFICYYLKQDVENPYNLAGE